MKRDMCGKRLSIPDVVLGNVDVQYVLELSADDVYNAISLCSASIISTKQNSHFQINYMKKDETLFTSV